MKSYRLILTIILLTFSTVKCFGTTWAAAYPYIQQIEGQSVVVKAYSHAPYDGGPMIGITKVYSNNKLLYSIDKYYREKLFTSQDGQYLVIVRTSNSAGLTSYTLFGREQINFNQTVIEVLKNGIPFKTFTFKDVIDTTQLVNNGYLFNWDYSVDLKKFENAQFECEACREVYGRRVIKTGNTKQISPKEWESCKNACDSLKLKKTEMNIIKNSIFVMDNSLFILTNQNTVVALDFETLNIQQLPFEKIVPDKKSFNPPKLKRKYKKIKLPDKFDEPNLKDGRSFEKGLADLLNLTIHDYSKKEPEAYCAYIRLVLNKEGKCIDFYGKVHDMRINEFMIDESIDKEMTDKLIKWLNEQKFDTKLIPKGFENYSFLCIVRLNEK